MRRRRFNAVRVLLAGLCVLLAGNRRLHAQLDPARVEGAPIFVLPIGARSLGMGQAGDAAAVGSDALWWNPALIARGPRELALHLTHGSSPIAETDAGGAFVYPVPRLGAFAVSIRYLNLGSQGAQPDANGQLGTFVNTSTALALTFAPTLTDRLSAGVTYKVLRDQYNCTGSCDNPANSPQTLALDFGFAYRITRDSTISIGGAVRNLGPKLQVKDVEQADALPGRASVGVLYAPHLTQLPVGARLRVAGDVVTYASGGGGSGFRLGGELAWQERYQLRAGYVAKGPNGSGPTFGFGIRTGKLQIDLAQMLSDLLSQSGQTPTFLSLRYIF